MSEGRRQAITGHWRGEIHQEQGPNGEPYDYCVLIDLIAKNKEITGKITTNDKNYGSVSFEVRGAFWHDNFLQLNYTPHDTGSIQFGSVILVLDPKGKTMDGRFVAYGRHAKAVISGTIVAKKKS